MNILSQVKIILGLETKGFPSARQQTKAFVEGAQRDIAQLKGFVGGFFTAQFASQLARSVTQMVGRFKDLNETSGEGLDTIQKYDQVFKKFGGTAEDAIKIWDELAIARKDALEKGGEAGLKLQRLGLTPEEIQSLDTGRKLYERIAQISNDPNNTAQRAAFMDQFGKKKGGMALAGAAALNEGGEFSIISDDQIKALDDAAKQFAKASTEFKIASVPLVAAIAEWVSKNGSGVYGEENPTDGPGKFLANMFGPANEQDARIQSAYDMRHEVGQRMTGNGIDEGQRQQLRDLWTEISEAIKDDLTDRQMAIFQTTFSSVLKGRNQKVPLPPKSSYGEGPVGYNEAVSEIIGRGNGARLSRMPADVAADRTAMGAAFDSVFFSASNTEEKKKQLRERMDRDEEAAKEFEGKGDFDAARKLRAGSVKNAGELSDLMRTPHKEFQSDQLAQVGGLIGGAATIDPSITIQQSQLQVLTSILNELPALRTALEQRNQPIHGLQ